jgi:Zn-dependent M28 family amino/carboxypeptidase
MAPLMMKLRFSKKRLLRAAIVLGALFAYYVGAGMIEQRRIAVPLPNDATGADVAMLADRAQLLGDVRTLALPEFEGRKTGTDGNRKAQAMLQQRFAALGLEPFGTGYAQPFSFSQFSIKGLFTPGRSARTEYASATNIIGYFRGTRDPLHCLVVSAHYDHLGIRNGKLYPGADDNASGVAALLAIASYFKSHPPQHTVVIAAFDGEEEGMRGSVAFMNALPFPRNQLAANLNLDMLSHNDSNQIFVAGTSQSPKLKPLVEQVARRSAVHIMLGHDRSPLVAGSVEDWTDSSDQSPFNDAGIAFLYFGVEDHADYHAPSDTFEHINPEFFVKVAAMVIDMATTLDQHLETVH